MIVSKRQIVLQISKLLVRRSKFELISIVIIEFRVESEPENCEKLNASLWIVGIIAAIKPFINHTNRRWRLKRAEELIKIYIYIQVNYLVSRKGILIIGTKRLVNILPEN